MQFATNLQINPVRGRLDPEDINGWRYLQCTETPGELKVLLPPQCVKDYSVLLKAEIHELQLGPSHTSWTSIIYIRRLKDRLIHKCERFSRNTPFPSDTVMIPAFRTLTAPEDFRVKEIEKWVRQNEPKTTDAVHTPKQDPVFSMHGRSSSQDLRTRLSKATLKPKQHPRIPENSLEAHLAKRPSTSRPTSSKSSLPLPFLMRPRPLNMPPSVIASDAKDDDEVLPSSDYDDNAEDSGDSTSDTLDDTSATLPTPHLVKSPERTDAPLSKDPSQSRPVLARRRSSLRRVSIASESGNLPPKTVSWAADRDWIEQMEKYENAMKELTVTDERYSSLVTSCHNDLGSISDLRLSLRAGLANLTTHMEYLTSLESTLETQENTWRDRLRLVESAIDAYKEKVNGVMGETKAIMELYMRKRDPNT